mgnify:CR=1 FL=1
MRILFVCVGNTCRSQMAQAAAKHMGHEAESAGTHPGGAIAANAIKVTSDLGIGMEGQYPKSVDEIDTAGFDRIISMGCGVSCPNVTLNDDWELTDPFGNDIIKYRQTRDEIERRVRELL